MLHAENATTGNFPLAPERRQRATHLTDSPEQATSSMVEIGST